MADFMVDKEQAIGIVSTYLSLQQATTLTSTIAELIWHGSAKSCCGKAWQQSKETVE